MEKLKLLATALRNLRRELVNTYAIAEDMQIKLDLLALNIERQTEEEMFIFSHGQYEEYYVQGVFNSYDLALKAAEAKKESYSRVEIYKINTLDSPEEIKLYSIDESDVCHRETFKSRQRYEEL